ncbi:hypothetical protein BH24ACT10_BH24ACT10_09030 [soil metagenome]
MTAPGRGWAAARRWARWALRGALGLTGTPQMVLRMGYAKGVAVTPRRDLSEVIG